MATKAGRGQRKKPKPKRLSLPDGSTIKWPHSEVEGVYFRNDGVGNNPRWEVKIRWTEVVDGKSQRFSRTYSHQQVDLNAKLGTRHHLDTARHAAENDARHALAKLKGAVGSKRSTFGGLAGEQTLESWLLRYEDELQRSQLPVGHSARPSHPILNKGWAQEASVIRTLVGPAKSGYNRNGFPEVTKLRIAEIEPHFVIDVLRRKMRGRKNEPAADSTITKTLAQISMVYKRAIIIWGYKVDNPFAQLKGLLASKDIVVSDGREVTIGADDFRFVMRHLKKAHIVTRAVIRFDLDTSCRRGEAVKLRWEDINWRGDVPTATFQNTKSKRGRKKGRTIPLLLPAVAMLRAMAMVQNYEAQCGTFILDQSRELPPLERPKTKREWAALRVPPLEGPVFRLKGKQLRADTVTQAWIRARERAAQERPHLAEVRVHDLRHTGTSRMIDEGGLTDLTAAKLVGHTNTSMTGRYYHHNAVMVGKKLKENYRRGKSISTTTDEEALAESLKGLTPEQFARVMAKFAQK